MIAISLLGPPGSGKTTQAKHIAEYLDLQWISPGHIFREIDSFLPQRSDEIRTYVNRGKSVPAELTYEVLLKWPQIDDNPNGYVFDSHPRNKDDYRHFKAFLDKKGASLEAIITLLVEKQELLSRLNRRAYVEGREDESETVIKKRIAVFEDQTKPLIDILEQEMDVYKVNGELSTDVVWEEIKALLSPVYEKTR